MKRWRDSITTTIALTVVVAMLLGFSLQRLVSSGLLYIGLAPQQGLIPLTQVRPHVVTGLLRRSGRAWLVKALKMAVVASSGTIPFPQAALNVVPA